ncbi:elonginA binding-protein 1 domain-containing protein [Phthorimaea operculella]|nr:elonginA binding-protein 1 domain-containing protein [Phthorimaea operculella]
MTDEDGESSTTATNDGIESGAILQKLVSAAVQKVLQQTEASTTSTSAQLQTSEECSDADKVNNTLTKATYNPTPIAELKKISTSEIEISNEDVTEQRKRHIPVPYTPRKPASLPIKRPVESNGATKPFVFIPPPVTYTPGCTESVKLDPYTPKGAAVSSDKYLPGAETQLQQYTPKETQAQPSSKHNYVPSDRTTNKKKLLEYKPTNISKKAETPSVTYQPTPKSLVPCFSSDEDEPDTKKLRLSNDLNGLDDLGPEFDILDQILDEEKLNHSDNIVEDSNNLKVNDDKTVVENSKKQKTSSHKHDDKKSTYKSNSKKSEEKTKHEDIDKINSSSDHKHKEHRKSDNKSSDYRKSDNKSSEHSKSHNKSSEHSNSDRKISEHSKSNNKSSDHSKSDRKVSEPSKSDNKSSDHSKSDRKISDHSKSNNKSSDHRKSDNKSSEPSKSDQKSSEHVKSDKSRDSDKKTHKSSSREKDREKRREKHSEKDGHAGTRSSEKSSKHSSSKSSDKHSKHSSSSNPKQDAKKKEKSEHHHKSSKDSSKDKHKKYKVKDKQSTNNNVTEKSDEESIALQCKRIFEEYVPTEKVGTNVDEVNNQITDSSNDIEYVPTKKRISRTSDKNIKVIPKAPLKPDYKVSASQTMAERLAKIKEFHASRGAQIPVNNEATLLKQEPAKTPAPLSAPHTNNAKIRIAHVPYASTMMNAKKTIMPIMKAKPEPSTSSTTIQTIKKGSQRVAHIPNEKFIDRPGVLEPLASKIAANIRSTYLNMMIDECLKIYLTATDAYARAQHEELMTSKKCSTVQIYKNSAVLTVSRLRKEFQECKGIKKSGADCSALQRIPHALSGNTSSVGSWSIESKRTANISQEFTGARFYKNISKWILTEEQLQENGFPRPHASGEKGRAIIYGQNKQTPPKGLIRTCCRCKKDYIVDKKGFPAISEECIYHPNRKYRVRGEAKYQCCSQDSSSDGCCVAPCHVYEYVDFENLKGFIKTMPPEKELDDYGVYSLDCEMCYTTQGLDLTRVTVINSACKVEYETLIKPLHPIIDYNTRYSGITEEQMANVTTTLDRRDLNPGLWIAVPPLYQLSYGRLADPVESFNLLMLVLKLKRRSSDICRKYLELLHG